MRAIMLAASAALLALIGCASAQSQTPPQGFEGAAKGAVAPVDVATLPVAQGWAVETVTEGLAHPWSIAWLPNGDALITERAGRLRIVRNGVLDPAPIEGVPPVLVLRQGGLLEVSAHPNFASNQLVYLTLAGGTPEANATRLVRARFDGRRLNDVTEIFRASPDKMAGFHFGSRILWLPDGSMLMSVGDGARYRDQAQILDNHLGKVLRLDADGKAKSGNPFNARTDATPEVWSYGHRNVQGLARAATGGAIYATEHGAQGGDEVNLLQAGRNYGWPLATYAVEYGPLRTPISPFQAAKDVPEPLAVWSPGIGPSGLVVYDGARFPGWQGDVFAGGLVGKVIVRLDLDARGAVLKHERLPMEWRIRDVRQGPDGYLYALTDEEQGRLVRIKPAG